MRITIRYGLALVAVAAPLCAQVFGPSGPEFRVNTTTTGGQYAPSVAIDRTFGDFIVTWTGPGPDGHLIFGRRFEQSGAPTDTDDFRVNGNTTGDHIVPRAAAGGLGQFVIVWERDSSTPATDVFGQRYDVFGEAGGTFGVNTTPDALVPAVAADFSLNFVVVWQVGSDILGQRFDSTSSPLGGEFQVNQGTTSSAFPAVARTSSGTFVAVYQKLSDVFARRYGAAGAPLGGEFQVNVLTGGTHERPRVAASPSGFVVAWHHVVNNEANVKARLFDSTGAPVTGEFRVNTQTTGSQWNADVAMDEGGNFVIVWHDDAISGLDGFSDGVFAQRYTNDGNPLGFQFRVNTTTTDTQRHPSVAMDSLGNFVVAWTDYRTTTSDIRAQRFCAALAGDVNNSKAIDVGDVFYLINSLFAGGPAPLRTGDANGDGITNVSDVFYLINYLFANGPSPACPLPY